MRDLYQIVGSRTAPSRGLDFGSDAAEQTVLRSPADGYATIQGEAEAAFVKRASTKGDSLSHRGLSYRLCTMKGCNRFDQFSFRGDKLTSFDISGSPLAEHTATGPVHLGGPGLAPKNVGSLGTARWALQNAYDTAHGALLVEVAFVSPDQPLMTDCAAARYVISGRSLRAADWACDATLPPNQAHGFLFIFNHARLGGHVRFRVTQGAKQGGTNISVPAPG
jgi:hypothetical protein